MFGQGIRLFRLFGFAVRLDWSWLVIAVLLTWSLARGVFPAYYGGLSAETYWWMGVVGAMGLFGSIVLHEYGHSLLARRFGIPMRGITLFIFGGVAEMGGEPPSPKAEFLIAIAGPVVTLGLAFAFWALAHWSQLADSVPAAVGVLGYLAWVNLLVLAFNLVPAFPLDGGRVLRSLLWAWKKNLRWATRIAAGCGTAFAFALMAWGLVSFLLGNLIGGIWAFLIGLFIRNASQVSYQQVLVRETLAGEPVRRLMTPNPVTVSSSASIKSIVEDFLYKYPYKFYPVVDDGQVLGCLSIDQVKMIPRDQWEGRTAQSVASPCSGENVVGPETDAAQALSAMNRTQASRLMVVEQGHLLGVVALKDLLNFLARKMELESA